MRVVAAVLLIGVLAGCTSVKMVQRDGCWVRRTEKRGLGTVTEEVGPCSRPATAFVENDPLTRMVQECVARADYRWQMRALAAWDRREPWPEQLSESSVLQQCMDDSARSVLGETEKLKERNAALEARIADLTNELASSRQKSEAERAELVRRGEEQRRELLERADDQRKELLTLHAKLAEHLGAAAKKVQPIPRPNPAIATATATSEGRSRADPPAQPATLAVVAPGAAGGVQPVCVPEPARAGSPSAKASQERKARSPSRVRDGPAVAAAKDLPACDPAKPPMQASNAADAPPPAAAEAGRTAPAAGAEVRTSSPGPTIGPAPDGPPR